MKLFLKNIFYYSLPLGIVLSLPLYILWVSGENFNNIDDVLQKDDKYLIGFAYKDDFNRYLKWSKVAKSDPYDVIALGSSRVLQFRQKMFTKRFYNAGYTIRVIDDFSSFLNSIPKKNYPKYLIIGLDQWMFNEAWAGSRKSRPIEYWSKGNLQQNILSDIKNVYIDLYNKKYGLNSLHTSSSDIDRYGLTAVVNNAGFSNDGSYDYGPRIMEQTKETRVELSRYGDVFGRIKNGNRRFEHGKNVSKESVKQLEDFLRLCKLNNIYVVAFLPPYADKVYNKISQNKNYLYLNSIVSEITPLFIKYDYEIYDFSSSSLCDSSDIEIIDGMHGGEVMYAKILNKIIHIDSKLKDYVDSKKVNQLIFNKLDS